MSQTSDPRLDVVTVATIAIGTIASEQIAGYLGPYIVIAAAGAVGGTAYVMRRPEPTPRMQAIGWVLLMTAVAVLLSAAAAHALEVVLATAGWAVPMRYLLAPVALGIAAVGGDWPAVLRWTANRLPWRGRREASHGGE